MNFIYEGVDGPARLSYVWFPRRGGSMAYIVIIFLKRVGVGASDEISCICHSQDDFDAEIEAAASMHGKACAFHCYVHILSVCLIMGCLAVCVQADSSYTS